MLFAPLHDTDILDQSNLDGFIPVVGLELGVMKVAKITNKDLHPSAGEIVEQITCGVSKEEVCRLYGISTADLKAIITSPLGQARATITRASIMNDPRYTTPKDKLFALQDLAVEAVEGVLLDGEASHKDKLSAAQTVFDRTNLPKQTTVNMNKDAPADGSLIARLKQELLNANATDAVEIPLDK